MNDLTRREFLEHAGAGLALAAAASIPPVPAPAARAGADGTLTLANARIAAAWRVSDGALRAVRVTDVVAGASLAPAADLFALTLADGTVVRAGDCTLAAGPRRARRRGRRGAARWAERLDADTLTARLVAADHGIAVTWTAVLGDGAHYVRQEVTIEAVGREVPLREVRLLDVELPGAAVAGSVPGSPVAGPGWFAGFESPLAQARVEGTRATMALARELPLRPGAPLVCSSVIGVTRAGQGRRDFLAYLERERAHPYRPFLHYNSWYDLGYFSPYGEADALAVIAAFGAELHERRGVRLDSFLFDDGWDDHRSLWHFNAGFPRGFAAVRRAAARYGAAPGVWMSPWGGYGRPREERLAYGKAQGFEENAGGFELSGPRYFARFRDVCLDMIRRYGVNQFKFDGTGNVNRVFPGSLFDSDFDAMLHLIARLRREAPALFVNLTTGTYPSPFFLASCDSIWRGGDDHAFAGVGTKRQQWITYRDADTYAGVVRKGPLFPLNSLMLHGIIYAKDAHDLSTDPGDDFRSEVRAYFGTGTQLQEMYVTPALLTAANWDDLAAAAAWARARAGVLVDTHWVGGDPAKLEPYGHAAWSAAGAVLCLRNPAGRPATLTLDAAEAFELPDGAPRRFALRAPWRDAAGAAGASVTLDAGVPHDFALAPFEVLTLESV